MNYFHENQPPVRVSETNFLLQNCTFLQTILYSVPTIRKQTSQCLQKTNLDSKIPELWSRVRELNKEIKMYISAQVKGVKIITIQKPLLWYSLLFIIVLLQKNCKFKNFLFISRSIDITLSNNSLFKQLSKRCLRHAIQLILLLRAENWWYIFIVEDKAHLTRTFTINFTSRIES